MVHCPTGVAYETHIYQTGYVTQHATNLHDFFQWADLVDVPHIKAQLNALQGRKLKKPAMRREADCVMRRRFLMKTQRFSSRLISI